MSSPALPETLQEAVEYFSNPDHCEAFMVALRWPAGVTCPACGSRNVLAFKTVQKPRPGAKNQEPRVIARFKCRERHARPQFTSKVGTIFEDSPIPLKSWLLATWMISNCKNGISSYELARALGVTQKTAWFMLHRIRLAMQAPGGGKLGGEVEVDETYIGGKARNMHKRRREKLKGRTWMGKAAVMGLLHRHPGTGKSRVRLQVVESVRKNRLHPIVEQHVEDGSTVYTDQLRSYENLDLYYKHQVINHAEAYARGEVHTNGMENFWSLLKRSIRGTYVSVEPFHLFRYLDEQAFRFNEREQDDAGRFVKTMTHVTGRRVTYKELIGAEAVD